MNADDELMAESIERLKLLRRYEALEAENAALRDALRVLAVVAIVPNGHGSKCRVCGSSWMYGEVSHAPGCLAAPRSEP